MKKNNPISVSVIIPHYNDVRRLRLCLQSLQTQSFPNEATEIIVADNGTPGGIEQIIAEFPHVRFVDVAERGAAPARNAALALATGDAIAFIDADCVAAPDWIETGLSGLADADYVGGQVEVTTEDNNHPSATEAFEKIFGFRQQLYLKRKHFSVTANLFVWRSVAEKIGPFKNFVAEDLDWGQRAHTLGFRLAFNCKSKVGHPARQNWDELVRKWDRVTLERWNGLDERRLFYRVKWACLAVMTAFSPLPHLWTVFASDKLSCLRDKIAAAGVLARIRWWRARRMFSFLTLSSARSS